MEKEASKEARASEAAESKAEAAQGQAPKRAPKKMQKVSQEPAYPVNELAANAKKAFGTRQECVEAALRAAGKTECTVAEAKGIVKRFLKKEVL